MVEQMDQEFSAFEKSNMDLVDSGFDVKVVYDHGELWRYLPEGMHFSSGDSELAVFDEDRIDIYSGFTKNGLPSARVFGRTTHRSFKTIYDMTINYVNGLWESPYAEDFASFAKELGSVIEENQYELDYEPNWLLKYDDDADQGDARLKQEELTFVIESLAGGGNGSSIERHLDLGTCTGRYLAALREHLEIGVSIGVDLDSDCIEHCKRKHRDALKNERRFRIMDADIRDSESLPGENFDLITCMMGTLCHLRRESSTGGPYEDPWQEGLHNLAVRLAKDGDAFVAIWNTDSLPGSSTPSLLSIYPRRSTEILLKQSPAKNEFEARLEQANLKAVSHSLIEKRLHVYHLQHASR
jgi:hypothetical protein